MRKRGLSFPAVMIIVLALIALIIASFFFVPIIKEQFEGKNGSGLRMINDSQAQVDDLNGGSETSNSDTNQDTTTQDNSNQDAQELIELQNQIPNCTDSDWTFNITPIDCPLTSNQTKTWTKIGSCENGVYHNVSETINCDYNTPTCTSFTYTSWNDCTSSGTQSRSVLSSLPGGCQNGIPVLSQECEYVAPNCVDGTSLNSCSLTKPLYCNAVGGLDSDCSLCGCDSGYVCESGSCELKPPLSPNLDTAEIRGSGNSKILIVDKDIKFPEGYQFTGQVAIAKEGVVLDCNGGTISGYETSFDKGIVVYSNSCAEDDSKLIKETSDHPSSNYKYYISPDIHDVTIKNCKVEDFVRGIDLVRYIYTRSFTEKDTNGEPIDLDESCVGPHKSTAVHPLIACAIDKVINSGYLFLGNQCNQHWLGAVEDPSLQGKALRREYYKRATAFYTKSTQELETPGIIETSFNSESPLFQFVTRNIILDNVEATDSNVGIYVDAYSSGFTIQNSNLHDNVRGIYLELGSSNTKIIDSQIINNENIGIAVDASFHNHIEGNRFERNGHAGIALYKNCGEKFEESVYAPVRYSGSNYNLIKDNLFTDHRLHEGQSSNIPTIQYPDSIAMKDPRSAGIWVAPRDGMLMERIVRQDGRILSCTGNLYDGETSADYPLRARIFSDNGEQLNAWNDYALGNEMINNIFTNNLYDKIIYNQPLSGEELPSLSPWINIKDWFRKLFGRE
jgi:parallel beta-helix repeat protein